jgi:hypothetical protein
MSGRNHRLGTGRKIDFDGKSMTVREWSEHLGIKYTTLLRRLNVMKWPLEKALVGRPRYDLRGSHRMLTATVNGVEKTMSMADWGRERGIPISTISQRLRREWTIEEALELDDQEGES